MLLLVENDGFPSDTRVMSEARTLVAAGYKVSVICPRFRGQKLHEVMDGIAVYRFPSSRQPAGLLGYVWEYSYSLTAMFLASLLVFFRRGFDVVHVQNPPDVLFVIGLFYKLLGKKLIFDHNDLTPELYLSRFGNGKPGNGKPLLGILLLMERLSCRLADLVVTSGEAYEELETTRDKTSPDKILLVRNSPNLERIQALSFHHPGRNGQKEAVLGFVGYLGRQDGADLLVKSLHHLAHDLGRRDFQCVVIGDGEMLDHLKQTAREMGIDGLVTFTGRLPWEEAMKRLSAVDICLEPAPSSPLNDRTTTVKAFEYMALQKPVVAFDLPAQRCVMEGAALFARANDELEFATRIAQLMDDRGLRESLGATGREKMEKELNWEHSAINLLQAYQRLI